MKKKVRNQPSVPYYSTEPAVSRKQIAGANQSQNASLGNKPNKVVDAKPGRMSGIANFTDKAKPAGKAMSPVGTKTPGAKAPPVSKAPKASAPPARKMGGIKPVKLKI